MKRAQTFRSLLLLIACCLIVSCGYGFVRYDDAEGKARRISVVTLVNDSEEPGVELLVSQALRHEILIRGGLELVSGQVRPDYVLRGRVLPVRTRSRSFTGEVLAREYEVTLRVELRVEAKGRPGLRRSEFVASDLYLASADSAVLRKNRQEALRYLSGLLARRVHDSMDREMLGLLQ